MSEEKEGGLEDNARDDSYLQRRKGWGKETDAEVKRVYQTPSSMEFVLDGKKVTLQIIDNVIIFPKAEPRAYDPETQRMVDAGYTCMNRFLGRGRCDKCVPNYNPRIWPNNRSCQNYREYRVTPVDISPENK